MQSRKPLRIEVPKEENLKLGRVGLIAVIGFGVGILWPRIAGMRLVPGVPNDKSETTSVELSGAPIDAGAKTTPAAVDSAEPPVKAPSAGLGIGKGEIASCRGPRGKKVEACDEIDFDGVARGRIATLSACDTARRSDGVLSLGFELDFAKDRVVGLQSGKSTSLPQEDVEALLACLKETLGEVSLAGIRHKHERYSIFYRVELTSDPDRKKVEPQANVEVTPASGKATVAWDVALVRGSPSRDSEVVARVLSGTRVSVTGRNGDWYRVKYDAKGGEGWVFRTAIGM